MQKHLVSEEMSPILSEKRLQNRMCIMSSILFMFTVYAQNF